MNSPSYAPGVTGAAATGPALSVKGLVKRFGETTAVGGLDFELQTGEILAILGPNGAGKTTTVEICEGFASRGCR